MAINVLKPRYRTKEVLKEIESCLDSGWTGMGNRTEEFERVWLAYSDFKNAHFVNSATSALHLAVSVFKMSYGWQEGDEIITTPITFISTNHAILYERLTPVFCDVDEYLCLDPSKLEALITSKTRAVMFVGMGGNVGRYDEILSICKKRGLKLILDASHMAGTKIERVYEGSAFTYSQVGWDADAAVFSFQAVKNLPTADSGMICFKEKDHDKLARQLSWLGIDKDTFNRSTSKGSYKWDYDVPNTGFKYNGNSIMASIAISQIKYLDQDNSYRRDLVSVYEEHLSTCKSVKIVPHNPKCKSSRHLFQILVENREDLLTYLYQHDVYPGVHYKNNKQYPMYSKCSGEIPCAESLSLKLVSLPLHINLIKEEVIKVSNLIQKYYE